MMKIIATARARAAAIRPVRMPLIRLRSPPCCCAGGAGGGGGAEPLAEGGGRALLAACCAAGSVMALLTSRTGPALARLAGSLLLTLVLGRARPHFPASALKVTSETRN